MSNQMTQQREASLGQAVKLGTRVMETIPSLGLTHDEAQSHIESDVLTEVVKIILKAKPEAVDLDKLREMVRSFLPFGDEEYTDSECVYKAGFPRKTWQQRLEILRNNIGGLFYEGLEDFIALLLERGVDAWVDDIVNPFLVPDWRTVGETYAEATVNMWALVAKSAAYKGHTYNYREGATTPDRLKLIDEPFYRELESAWGCQLHGIPAATAHERLRELRPTALTVWPVFAQTGLRHRGRSVRRSHVRFSETEWGCGPFEMLCILLTDGEDRMTAFEHLGMDAPGAFYRSETDEEFDSALCSDVDGGGRLRLRGVWIGSPGQGFGSVSASLR